MKKLISLVLMALVLLALMGCGYGSQYKMNHCTHQFEETERIEATCTDTGKITYRCPLCGFTKYETLKATGHTTDKDANGFLVPDKVVPATCTKEGARYYTCSVCGKEYAITTEKSAHQFVNHICKVCGAADKPIFFTDMKQKPMSSYDYQKFSANIHNYTGRKISFVEVTLELYDSNGKIVDTDWTYAVGSEGLKDQSSAYFEIIYHGLNSWEYSQWALSIKSYD